MQSHKCNKYLQAFVAITGLLLLQLALAVVPPTLNYQGHITDNAGVPIDGPVNMSFSIYNVDTGGTALWSDTRAVTVEQGVFSVELGGGGNPFPLGLFENPLWMGLTVGTDAEMTPRRPISSTAYSFKADDANTLEGVSASTLDQSAHVIDTANPHAVSPAQIGAADAAALSAHTTDTGNPHSVTAAQTGSVTSADFTTHTGNNSAHHSRYTNSEAVTAMGTKSDGNPLHHDRYTDSNVVTVMLANDGAGSALDADKVDGLEASELIDAAQDEVRTPISALPFSINQAGSYYLTGNLDGSSGGLNVMVNNVTIDLMGFTIDGGGSVNDYGIDFTLRNRVVIKNGVVTGFGLAGIYQGNTNGRYATISDMQVTGNGTLGTSSGYSGIYLVSDDVRVERCTVGDNGGSGISTYDNAVILDNTVYNNSGPYGIYARYGGSVTGNLTHDNDGWGMYVSVGSLVKDNVIYGNNTLDDTARGGLYLSNDNLVINNTLDGNNQRNIRVAVGDNALIANHVTDSNYGIEFAGVGNYYRNNTAAGNNTPYIGYIPTGTGDGGGNVSF